MIACRARLALLSILFAVVAAAPGRAQGPKDLIKVPITQVPPAAKKALVIGAGSYQHANALSLSVKDAKAFAALLREKMGFAADAVSLMTDDAPDPDDRPTYTNLRGRVRRLTQSVGDDTVVVFFYSGHGVNEDGEDWLVPLDGDPDDVRGTCLSAIRELVNPLKVKQYNRALLFFDACRSVVSKREVRGGNFGLSTKAVALPQMAELYSCQARQVSLEGRGSISNGVFTHFLLRALEGDPEAADPGGNVTFDMLNRYVRGSVSDYVKNQFGVDQDPIGYATSGEMVLATAVKAAPSPVAEGGAAGLAREAFDLLDRMKNSEAAAKAREAIAKEPGNALAHAVLGGARLRFDDLAEGEREIREALRLDQNSALGHAGLGFILAKQKRRQDARREYERAVELDPRLAIAHADLGALYRLEHRIEEAEREWRLAADLWSTAGADRALPYIALADIYSNSKRFEEAGRYAEKAIGIEPNSPIPHFVVGFFQIYSQQLEKAEQEFKRAIELSPNMGMLYIGPGTLALMRQAYDEAEKDYKKWSEIEPENPTGYLIAAAYYLGVRKLDDAEREYRRAIELAPQEAGYHWILGDFYRQHNRPNDAERELKRASELDP